MDQIRIPGGEVLYKEYLPNGLAVLVLPKKQFLRTFGILSVRYGSFDSKFRVPGGDVVEVPRALPISSSTSSSRKRRAASLTAMLPGERR